MNNQTRRQLLKSAAGVAVVATTGLGLPSLVSANEVAIKPKPLTIPPQLLPNKINGLSTYDLVMQNGETEIVDGYLTKTSGINASFLGPSLYMRRGERAEVIIDLKASETVQLVNVALGRGNIMMGENNNAPAFSFLELRPAQSLSAAPSLPNKLTAIDWLDEAQAVSERTFKLEMQMGMMAMMSSSSHSHSINGKVMDLQRIDERVKKGTTEIWRLENVSMMAHPFHMHDVQFQIIDRDGAPPAANERGRKDVVLVNAGETVRIIMHFEDYADEHYPYMYHCHILEHEDAGMMGQFLVVD